MLNDSILADRLNLYREGQINEIESDENESENSEPNIITNLLTIAFKLMEIGIMFLRSLVFGFAEKTVFSTDWNFIEILAVGATTELILTNIFNLFKRKNI